jgi:hypothetical protein
MNRRDRALGPWACSVHSAAGMTSSRSLLRSILAFTGALLFSVVAPPLAGSARAEALGPQHVLVVLVNIDDPSWTDADLRKRAEDDLALFAAAYREYSWNAVSFDFQILGPYHPTLDGCEDSSVPGAFKYNEDVILRKGVAAVDPIVDFSTVHQMMVLHVTSFKCPVGDSGEPRAVRDIATNEGPLDSSVAWAGEGDPSQVFTIAHEFGHTLGGSHTEPRLCYTNPSDPTTRVPINHSSSMQCVLGPPWYLTQDVQCVGGGLHHFSINQKELFGWVAPSQIVTATRGVFTIEPTETQSAAVRAVRVPLTGSQWKYYYLEYRSAIGLDADQTPGVYLYAVSNSATSTGQRLIEPPPFVSNTEFTARPLPLGQLAACVPQLSYVDVSQDLAITVTSMSPTGATVALTSPADPNPPGPILDCPPNPPEE